MQRTAPVLQLVGEHVGEDRPTLLKDGSVEAALLCTTARSGHVGNRKFLHSHLAKSARYGGAALVQPMIARRGGSAMKLCHNKALLKPAARSLLATCQRALSATTLSRHGTN